MIRLDVSHWKDSQYKEGTLLFVQTFLESVFIYSFDSYKAPALNMHFLCYDFSSTVRLVEQRVMSKGNLIPLYEELDYNLDNNVSMQNFQIDKESFYSFKDKHGNFYSIEKNTNSKNDNQSEESPYKVNKKIKDSVGYLLNLFETDSSYINNLLTLLVENIKAEEFNFVNMQNIVELTRCISTELINAGYSKIYLYETILEHFFNSENEISNNIEHLSDFIKLVNLKRKQYKVVLGINGKSYNFLENTVSCKFKKARGKAKSIYNIQNGWICEVDDVFALDSYAAQQEAMRQIQPIISIQKIAKHSQKNYISNKSRVIDKNNNISKLVNKNYNPMRVGTDKTNDLAKTNMLSVIQNISQIPYSFFKMIELHSSALDNKDKTNQLLNLWTIIEIFVETDISDNDKINQICNALTTILCADYISIKLVTLFKDMNSCCPKVLEEYLPNIEIGDDLYKKFLALISIKKYEKEFNEMIEKLDDCPLIKFRLAEFHNVIFKDSLGILECLEKHSQRLKWHIMRIYRNRNMIVHDGEHMPYINTIIENLHYYVDAIFSKMMTYYKSGFFTTNNILLDLKNREFMYYKLLGKKTENKKKNIAVEITEENYLELILGNSTYDVSVRIIEDEEKDKTLTS